ncbi:hypothetical protein QTP88_012770 [Uroleucon formosanum]
MAMLQGWGIRLDVGDSMTLVRTVAVILLDDIISSILQIANGNIYDFFITYTAPEYFSQLQFIIVKIFDERSEMYSKICLISNSKIKFIRHPPLKRKIDKGNLKIISNLCCHNCKNRSAR